MKIDKSLFEKNIFSIITHIRYFSLIVKKEYGIDINLNKPDHKQEVDKLFLKAQYALNDYEIIYSKDGFPIPVNKINHRRLHSIYNPLRENVLSLNDSNLKDINDIKDIKGKNNIEKSQKENCECRVFNIYEIFGAGFLYNIPDRGFSQSFEEDIKIEKSSDSNVFKDKIENEIRKRYRNIFFIIDNSLDLILLASIFRDLTSVFSSNIIHIIIPDTFNDTEIYENISGEVANCFNPLYFHSIVRKTNRNQLDERQIESLVKFWENFRKQKIFEYKTYIYNFERNLANTIINLKKLMQPGSNFIISDRDTISDFNSPDKKTFNEFKDSYNSGDNGQKKSQVLSFFSLIKHVNSSKKSKESALIVGASPSLDINENKLKMINIIDDENPFIITVDNGYNFCYENNIIPDLIVILDNRSIIKLMFSDNDLTRNIPVLIPLSANSGIFDFFKTKYLYVIADIDIERFILLFPEIYSLNCQNSFREKNYWLSNPEDLYSLLACLQIPSKNVGGFCYLLLKYLKFKNIYPFGIDFSFINRKYYYSCSYFYDFHNIRQNYYTTTDKISVISTLQKGEKFLFEQYKTEWKYIVHQSIKLDMISNNKPKPKIFNNENAIFDSISESILNIVSCFFMKGYSKSESICITENFLNTLLDKKLTHPSN